MREIEVENKVSLEPNRSEVKELSSSNPTQDILREFLHSLDVKESSRALYKRTLQRFFLWVQENGHAFQDLKRPHLLGYKADLLESGLSSLTVGSYITSLRRFYGWAEANKYYPNVAKGIKTPKRKQAFKKQPLQPEQATALLDYYEDKAKRDFAIVNLLLRTGLRTIEVVRANVEDITFKGAQRVLLVHGKGRDEKDNFVVLTDKAYKPIQEYLLTRGTLPQQAPLFSSSSNQNQGKRLTTRTISKIAKEGLKAIGLDTRDYTAHSLRHTTAVNILKAGGSIETVQFTLRHSNPATSQVYVATLNEERRLQASGEALLDAMY